MRKGFTLIELLVVIAIIAMLVAIILPALKEVKSQAKRIVCLGHLRSCALAGVVYSQENDGKFPFCHMDTPNANKSTGTSYGSYAIWIQGLQAMPNTNGFIAHGLLAYHGYIDVPKIFYCPANRDETLRYGKQSPGINGGGWPEGRVPEDLPTGQIWVQSTYHYRSLWDGGEWRAVNSVKDGSSVGFMVDVFSDPRRSLDWHHKTGYNVAYVDGHCQFVKDKDFAVRDYNGGLRYHTNHGLQDEVWKKFLDEGARYPLFN